MTSSSTRVATATLSLALVLSLALGSTVRAASLYDQLGGEAGITGVVSDFIGFVAADSRINHFFAHANIPRLQKLLVEQISSATGGPDTYTGRSMEVAHKGMDIKDADFNALVEDLEKSLDKHDVPTQQQNRLLAILAPLRSSVDYR